MSKAKQGDFLKQLKAPKAAAKRDPRFTWSKPVAPAPRGSAPDHPVVRRNDLKPKEAPARSSLPRNSIGQPDMGRIRAHLARIGKKGK